MIEAGEVPRFISRSLLEMFSNIVEIDAGSGWAAFMNKAPEDLFSVRMLLSRRGSVSHRYAASRREKAFVQPKERFKAAKRRIPLVYINERRDRAYARLLKEDWMFLGATVGRLNPEWGKQFQLLGISHQEAAAWPIKRQVERH